MKAKRGDYCSVTRARRGTEEREELISQGEEVCSKDGDFLSQKRNEILVGIFSTPAGLAEQKNSEVVFFSQEIEKISSEVVKASTWINE